ncbi:MAG TPA: type II toxin-antitoxin system VapC family toxin [Bryobacteraceae bacterium]|nr:type II toxin-antitoxin system VapC family toxin [Bryobacteraceae bacterium]
MGRSGGSRSLPRGRNLNGYLLDTNVVLLALEAPERLTRAGRAAIKSGPNVLSAISYWEVILKTAQGKLDVGNPRAWWEIALGDFAATAMPLRPAHISEIHGLPPIHRDPFDRALIAQATAEDLVLVTMDDKIALYASKRLRILR